MQLNLKYMLLVLGRMLSPGDGKKCTKVTMVGTAGAGAVPGRVGGCTMIQFGQENEDASKRCTDQSLLFDLGRGSFTRLLELDDAFSMKSIDAVFLSHSHQDHVFDVSHSLYCS